jgi:DNA polymerase I-like protein with 3'-5' exonuclease and polymerase domains
LVQKRSDLERSLRVTFPPIEVADGKPKRWKRNQVCRKYDECDTRWHPPRVKGELHQKMKTVEFNPASTQHIAKRLIDLYGWEPQAFTPGGQPQITDEILRELPWAEAIQCADYQVVKKALAYVSEGSNGWLKLVSNGRIHGRVQATGAVTNRASHSKPNLANVPSKDKAYGKECRKLFVAGGGDVPSEYVLVGCDASSLQLSIYSHFVSKFDNGELAALCADEDGDPHEFMRQASGLFYRENQKTLTYATWFGAQHYKQGCIVLNDWRMAYEEGLEAEPAPSMKKAGALGKAVDARMRMNMKGFNEMNKACEKAGRRGYLFGLDGRKIPVQQERLALLTLLQGNEAIVMKNAYVLACAALAGSVDLGMAHPVLWVHDEYQWAVEPTHAEAVGQILVESITKAGEKLSLRLKLLANYKVGATWADTH